MTEMTREMMETMGETTVTSVAIRSYNIQHYNIPQKQKTALHEANWLSCFTLVCSDEEMVRIVIAIKID